MERIRFSEFLDAHPGEPAGGLLQAFLDSIASCPRSRTRLSAGAKFYTQAFATVDLGGYVFVIDMPIRLHGLHGMVLTSGLIEPSPRFPEGEYLLDVRDVNTLKIENIGLECRKRASGIFAHRFLRLRIEDCTIVHQRDFGIYANEKGYNHELEVVKCNIVEYLWGDGTGADHPGEIPNFRKAANRTSTGIFLGQADNVVSDCNINLCRVGIEVGMRANRIQGNHITAGGTVENALFDGILLNAHIKSSCLIVNNYIDNCRLVIRVDDKAVNRRNYVTITDNLFYRGFNHPKEGPAFSHIQIQALKPKSILQNIIISDNQFYTQDENLGDAVERVIRPVAIEACWESASESAIPLDPVKIRGAIMKNNSFTNAPPYFEVPMGTNATMTLLPSGMAADRYEADFSGHLAWGDIQTVSVTMISSDPEFVGVPFVATFSGKTVMIRTATPVIAGFHVTVDVNNSYAARWRGIKVN
ncbi:right-handed parallel beta-helix repeat-containing protein [Methylotetracoccus oryzae]|uniref:right-handed parallel beta-helix repeat-containing protein n=1 Tax=Methylotetracoccus oryzae TaxID=1919059 RepID=UPI00111A19EC|nr:right-handed parallel beta-helix repeat-containing protein [Methylotetracoccus oryzae]